jgi:hypothetical protein
MTRAVYAASYFLIARLPSSAWNKVAAAVQVCFKAVDEPKHHKN